ncbi:sigma-70 family RNA polymerase sigma factor [Lachnospiraceae bacterium 62-26]
MNEVMNDEQKQLVTAYLSLVPRMIRSLTQSFTHLSRDEFDELTQTGYLALCNAAMKCSPAQPFLPYARAAIRNAIYDYWRDCGKRKNAFCSLDAILTSEDGSTYEPEFMLLKADTLSPEQAVLSKESSSYLKRLECAGSNYLKKGIISLRLQQSRYTSAEAAKIYGVPSNHVRAWQSKARKHLREDQELYALLA